MAVLMASGAHPRQHGAHPPAQVDGGQHGVHHVATLQNSGFGGCPDLVRVVSACCLFFFLLLWPLSGMLSNFSRCSS